MAREVATMSTTGPVAPPPAAQPSGSQPPKDLIGFLDYYFVQKAPFQIPDNAREWLVKFAPWIIVVLLVLTLPLLLLALGLSTALAPFAGPAYAVGLGYLVIFIVAEVALRVAALPGLFARRMAGWRLLFYAQLVGVAFSLLSGAIIGAILSFVIGMYVLFQVRTLYK